MALSMRDREQGFEAKFAHDEEMRFMVHARRDKLFARWAAAELGLDAEQTEALVQSIVHIQDGPSHDRILVDTIARRLAGHSTVRAEALPAILARCLAAAHAALDGTAHGTPT